MKNPYEMDRYELEQECYSLKIPVFETDSDAILAELIAGHQDRNIYYDI